MEDSTKQVNDKKMKDIDMDNNQGTISLETTVGKEIEIDIDDSPRVEEDFPLPHDLIPLVEKMAENVHDVWAKTRIDQGWTYGPERDDAEKKHPCLVPYDQLPEEEKVYDRNTSIETLKFIMTAGFTIKKNDE